VVIHGLLRQAPPPETPGTEPVEVPFVGLISSTNRGTVN
jgi:hypothetical protein